MARNYTNRGNKWEWVNSWWILLTLSPLGIASFIAFFYVGYKVKHKKWRLFGFVYLGALTIVFSTPDSGIGVLVGLSSWVISIIHAFRIRPAYLIQLDVLKENQLIIHQEKISKLRQEAAERFERSTQEKIMPSEMKQQTGAENTTTILQSISHESTQTEKVKKIDLNSASEAEIASIKAIGLILAKKVLLKRKELGGFESFEQFVKVIGLNEHKAEKIKPLVEISVKEKVATQQSSGRLIDF